MDFSIFQERLQHLMDSRGLSCNSLSEEINCSPAAISRYLNGRRFPDLKQIAKLADFFNVSIDWLLGISGERYDVFPDEIQEVAFLYSLASPDDRTVVNAVLNKYKTKE